MHKNTLTLVFAGSLLLVGSAWILFEPSESGSTPVNSPESKLADSVTAAERPGEPPTAQRSALAGPENPAAPSVLHKSADDRLSFAERFAEFRKSFRGGSGFSPQSVASPDFNRNLKSPLRGLRIRVRNLDFTAEELHAEIDRNPDQKSWLILALPFSEGASPKDIAYLEALGAGQQSEATSLIAIHALNSFRSTYPEEALGAMWATADKLLANFAEGAEPNSSAIRPSVLALALTEEFETPQQTAQVEDLLSNPAAPEELRVEALKLLARTGGPDGAQRALSALVTGEPGALDAVRSIRDASAALELQALAERPLLSPEDIETAAAAFTGLVAADPAAALDLLSDSLLPRFEEAEGLERERLNALIESSIAGISDPRDVGPASILAHQIWGDAGVFPAQKYPPAWKDAILKSLASTIPGAWQFPSGDQQEEACRGLRWALERLPPESNQYKGLISQLIRFGRAEDLQFVEQSPILADYPTLQRTLAERREDDRLGIVSLSR